MEKSLEELKLEAEEERMCRYIQRFGGVPQLKEEDERLTKFNN
jgi:hypothetical protein